MADTMNRFPLLAKVSMVLMRGQIERLTQDTKLHEAHTINLIKRFAFQSMAASRPKAYLREQEINESKR